MCGICGELRFDDMPGTADRTTLMRDTLRHRGPDDQGLWSAAFTGGSVALGHTRLSIIDLSAAGHQPMTGSSGRYWISFNGEIYNYVEIRDELKKIGVPVTTKTDTEVLLAAYIHYGPHCLDLFNGMFAFAIWDTRKEELFCARDRLGVKPFYYHTTNSSFAFASEIKGLLCLPYVKREPDFCTAYDYLSLGLMHHNDCTFYAQIHQLPAGHFLIVNREGCKATRYWNLPDTLPDPAERFDPGQILDLFNDSVRLRLRSDVPVGVLLSGGLDSSSITALAASQSQQPLEAFSIEFDDPEANESQHAGLVAQHCGAHLRLLRPQGNGLWQELDDLIRAQDGPTHAPEVYSNWCMMRSVAECNVKVLLCGQGGDELFGGYNWYPKYFCSSLVKMQKFGTLLKELSLLPRNFPNTNTRSIGTLLGLTVQALLPIFAKCMIKPELRCIDTICSGAFLRQMRKRDASNLSILDPSRLEQKMHNDLLMGTVPQYLRYEDANSMHFAIEERVPMLDYRLVEKMHSLPVFWKFRGGVSKYALRLIMKDLLPAAIQSRKDKRGLSAPHDSWFRNDLRETITGFFTSDCRVYDTHILERKSFTSALKLYLDGKPTGLSRLLWRCINLVKWLRLYIP